MDWNFVGLHVKLLILCISKKGVIVLTIHG
jgi:hypothetical protein